MIADDLHSLPHTLRPVDVRDKPPAELDVLVGFDENLAGESDRISTPSAACPPASTPALEQPMGSRNSHLVVLEIPSRCDYLPRLPRPTAASSLRATRTTRLKQG